MSDWLLVLLGIDMGFQLSVFFAVLMTAIGEGEIKSKSDFLKLAFKCLTPFLWVVLLFIEIYNWWNKLEE